MPAGHARDRARRLVRRTRWLPVAMAGLAVLLLAGCNGAAGPAAGGAAQVRSSSCPPEYPHRLKIATRAVIGVPPLRQVSACVEDRRTGPVLLVNGGNAVWVTVAPGHESTLVQHDGQASWLRDRIAMPEGLLLPGSAVLVWARPGEVSWRLNREWSVAWNSFQAGVGALAQRGRDSAEAALAAGPDSPRGRALVSCALTAWHLYRTALGDPLPTHDGLGALEMTWSSSSSACAEDWQRADRFLTGQGTTPTTWSTAVSRADAWVGRGRPLLNWLEAGTLVQIRVR